MVLFHDLNKHVGADQPQHKGRTDDSLHEQLATDRLQSLLQEYRYRVSLLRAEVLLEKQGHYLVGQVVKRP